MQNICPQQKACEQLDTASWSEQNDNYLPHFDKCLKDVFFKKKNVPKHVDCIIWLHLFDSVFSPLKVLRSVYYSTMSDDDLKLCLRLFTSIYSPDYATLDDSIQCKSSCVFKQLFSSVEWGEGCIHVCKYCYHSDNVTAF